MRKLISRFRAWISVKLFPSYPKYEWKEEVDPNDPYTKIVTRTNPQTGETLVGRMDTFPRDAVVYSDEELEEMGILLRNM